MSLLHEGARLRVDIAEPAARTTLRFIGTGRAPEDLRIEGLELAREMNRVSGSGEARTLRLGPGEWLAIGWPCAKREALPDSVFAVDVGDGLASFEIRGAAARALVAGACTLDLDASAFPPGTATRTRFARATAIVECTGDDAFLLHVDRSLSDYVAKWLARHAPFVEQLD